MTAATGFVSDFDLAAALDEVLEGFPTEADIDPDNEFLWAELGSLAATAVNSVGNFVADHPVLTGVVAAGVAISVGLFLIGIGPGVLVAGLGAGIAAAFSQLSLGTVSAAAAVLLLALLSQTPAYATTPVVAASGTGSSPTASSSADPTPSVQPTSPSSWGSCSGSGPNNGCGTCSECDGRNGALACYPCSGGIFGTCSSSTVCD